MKTERKRDDQGIRQTTTPPGALSMLENSLVGSPCNESLTYACKKAT